MEAKWVGTLCKRAYRALDSGLATARRILALRASICVDLRRLRQIYIKQASQRGEPCKHVCELFAESCHVVRVLADFLREFADFFDEPREGEGDTAFSVAFVIDCLDLVLKFLDCHELP